MAKDLNKPEDLDILHKFLPKVPTEEGILINKEISEGNPAFHLYRKRLRAINLTLWQLLQKNRRGKIQLDSITSTVICKLFYLIEEWEKKQTQGSLLTSNDSLPKPLQEKINTVFKEETAKKLAVALGDDSFNNYKHYYSSTTKMYCDTLGIPFQGVFSYDTVKTLKKWYLINQYVTKNRCKTNKNIKLEALNNSLNITKDFAFSITAADINSYWEDYCNLKTKINTIKEICREQGITKLKDARNFKPVFTSKGISESVLMLYFENYTTEAIWNYKCSFMKDICEDLITLGWNQNNYQDSPYLQRISTDEEGNQIKMPFTERDLKRYWPIFEEQQHIPPEEKMENILKYYKGKYADCTNYTPGEITEAKKRRKEKQEQKREENQNKAWDSKKEQIEDWFNRQTYFNSIQEVLDDRENRYDIKTVFEIPHLITRKDLERYQQEVEEHPTCINTNPTTLPQNDTSKNQPTPQGISGRPSSKPSEAEEKITPQQAFFDNILHDEKRVINDLASLIKKTNGKSWKNINWKTLTTKFNSIKNNNQVLLSKIKRSTSKDPRNQQEKEGVLPLWRNIALHINNQNGTYTVVDIKNDYQYAA